MSSARALAAAAMAMFLSGCEQRAQSVAPAAPRILPVGLDESSIVAQVREQLAARTVFNPMGPPGRCTEEFDIGQPVITNKRIEGTSGDVEASTPILSRVDLQENSDLALMCFGAPRGGIRAGQTMNYVHTYRVEKWDSGWRLAQGR